MLPVEWRCQSQAHDVVVDNEPNVTKDTNQYEQKLNEVEEGMDMRIGRKGVDERMAFRRTWQGSPESEGLYECRSLDWLMLVHEAIPRRTGWCSLGVA